MYTTKSGRTSRPNPRMADYVTYDRQQQTSGSREPRPTPDRAACSSTISTERRLLEARLERLKIEEEMAATRLELSRREEELRDSSSPPSSRDSARSTSRPLRSDAPPFLPDYLLPRNSPIFLADSAVHANERPRTRISNAAEPPVQGAPLVAELRTRMSNAAEPPVQGASSVAYAPYAKHPAASRTDPQEQDTLSKLVALLSDKRDALPRMEPEVFAGRLLDFPVWLKSFEVLIESRTASPSERLYYLSRYTTGDARQAIQGILTLDSTDAYAKAKTTLIRRFGDKYKVSEAFKSQIHSWPPIKAGDGEGLQKLADFLQQCNAAMASISYLRSLDSAEENQQIVAKLPRYIADRWNRVVDRWLYGTEEEAFDADFEGQYPAFSTFCTFLAHEARVACGPGSLMNSSDRATKTVRPRNVGAFTSLAQNSSEEQPSDAPVQQPRPYKPFCQICKEEHVTESCNAFLAMSEEEQRDLALKNGLCFNCLRKGHRASQCRKRKSIIPRPQEVAPSPRTDTASQNAATSYRIESSSNDQDAYHHSMIIPVSVHHRSRPGNVVKTYALLDNQSNACFLSEVLLEKLRPDEKVEDVSLKLTTVADQRTVASKIINNLVVRGLNEVTEVALPGTYTRPMIPVDRSQIPSAETVATWPHLKDVADKLLPRKADLEVGLLIGFNCSAALLPREIVAGDDNEPFATRTILGWGVTGVVGQISPPKDLDKKVRANRSHFVFRTQVAEVSPTQVKQMFELEFNEQGSNDQLSVEDRKFLKKMEEGIRHRADGHFELPLPLKQDDLSLPNNKASALRRLNGLKKRLDSNPDFKAKYDAFMKQTIESGYAEVAPLDTTPEIAKRVWYLPHHGVCNPKKPDKIRVVFDCAHEYHGEVLNHHLLQGPDLLNSLTGILCRFRQEQIALSCDIEGMFLQVGVPSAHRDLLRFLWYQDGDTNKTPVAYRMTTHPFGATSSPGCANFALRAAADLFEKECGKQAADFVRRDFYVDDGLKSVSSSEEAERLVRDSREICRRGGFNLHKFACNDKDVLRSIPSELQAKDIQKLDLANEELPMSRTLGVQWCIESDTFQFRIELKDTPLTRRGMLSTVSSIYDPLGLVAPVLMVGKTLLQGICRDGRGWDDPIPEETEDRWRCWRLELTELAKLRINRCYKPKTFGKPRLIELHHFADASQFGYGSCSYLRQINQSGEVCSSLVMAKARVASSKPVTIPRMELTAAVLAVKIAKLLERELDLEPKIKHTYWSDSKIVLGYIANEARRFHIFVANRVQQIRDSSDPEEWNHIDTKLNPADMSSRGTSADELITSNLWWNGPPFLSKHDPLPLTTTPDGTNLEDPEVKHVAVLTTQTRPDFPSEMLSRLERFSTWHSARRAIAACLRYMQRLKDAAAKRKETVHRTLPHGTKESYDSVNTAEIMTAERAILKLVQFQAFPEERTILKRLGKYPNRNCDAKLRNTTMKQTSCLYKLDPYIGSDGLVRVGGRIRRANVPREIAHPIVIPKSGHVTRLIIGYCHQGTQHAGRTTTLNQVRAAGFWIVKARAAVASYVWQCVTCRKLRGATASQKMSDLPIERLEPAPPFSYSGVDFFGPFYVKEGRSEKKRWGVLFTCLASRAIHLEVAHSLTTDSFLNAYRRFVGRRGDIRQLRCDRGTNFVGAKGELEAALNQMNENKIKRELVKQNCDWVEFRMNIPYASHMGGVWERMVRCVRSVLSSLLSLHGSRLDDELLHTFLVEAEAVVNSRPITYVEDSHDAPVPLSPSQLLTLRSKAILPPPGRFMKEDLYCRKRWRRVQFLANEFWQRWLKEYLPTLQQRNKWKSPQPDLAKGDVVLMLEPNVPRNQWPMAVVEEAHPSLDTHVRKVTLRTASSTYTRPVHKIVPLLQPLSQPSNT